MVCFENRKIKDIKLRDLFDADDDKSYMCFFTSDEFAKVDLDAFLKQNMLEEFDSNESAKFEHHDTFDLIYLSIPKQLSTKTMHAPYAHTY